MSVGRICAVPVILLAFLLVPSVADARPRTTKVTVRSSPPGAAVFVDARAGVAVGVTPWTGRLTRTTHTIWVEHPGHVTHEQTIKLGARAQTLNVTLAPVPLPAVIEVALRDPKIPGAVLWIDGSALGPVPTQIEVTPGRHLVEVAADKRERFTKWVDVAAGERLMLVTPLPVRQTTSTLVIDADVANAEVWIDGRRLDGTSPLVTVVKAGAHVVEIRKGSAPAYLQRIVAQPGERVVIVGTLADAVARSRAGRIRVTSSVPASVVLDGGGVGTTPLTLEDLTPGPHVVELVAEGHAPRIERLEVPAGGTLMISAELAYARVGRSR